MAETEEQASSWDLEDHIRGTLYGQCIGDAIGLLTEFMTKEEANETYAEHKDNLEYEHKFEDGHRRRWKPGDWTDDSDQMILILDSLLENEGKVDVVDIANRFLGWARRGFPELGDIVGMGIGATTSHVMKHEKYKEDPHFAAKDIWTKTGCVVAPNGAVMRTSILGIHQYHTIESVVLNANSISKITHADPRCAASCVAVSGAIAYMLQRQPKHMISDDQYNIPVIQQECYQLAKPCLQGKHYKKYKKEMKKYMFAKKLENLQLSDSKSIGYTYKAMGSGFWAMRQENFRQAMQQLLLEGGDADTNGAVAGSLLGCKLGARKLPPSWRDTLLHKAWLDEKIIKFLELMKVKK